MRIAFLMGALVLAGACNASVPGNGAAADGGNGAAPVANGAATQAAGTAGARDFQVSAFDRIALTGASDVVVAVGGQPSVRAEGDAALIERLEIAVVDGELRIGMKPGTTWSGDNGGDNGRLTLRGTPPPL